MIKSAEASVVEETPSTRSVSAFVAALRPGDILITAPRAVKLKGTHRIINSIYKPISRKVQNTDYGHSSIYVGGGKVVDPRFGGIKKVDIRSMLGWNNAIALRPRATDHQRQRAIKYANSVVTTKKGYSYLDLLRSATPFRGTREGRKVVAANKLICSAVIANAYRDFKFSDVSKKFVRPSEILLSDRVDPILKLERK